MDQPRLSDSHLLSSAWSEIEKSLTEFIQMQEQTVDLPLSLDFERQRNVPQFDSQAAA